jgi:tight adherence protein B
LEYYVIIPAIIGGIIVAIGAYMSRGAIYAKFERDIEWHRMAHMRFSPEPIDARKRCIQGYVMSLLWLIGLLYVMPSPLFAVPLWLLGQLIPKFWHEWMWRRRRRQIDMQLPAAIATMANSVKAGLTLVQAIQRLGETAPEPIRTEFKQMSNQYNYGSDLDTVMRDAKKRVDLPNFLLFASAVLMNREMGGDVSQTLLRISVSLEKIHQMRRTVAAHTSEGRTNIKVLLFAPPFMLALIASVDPDGVKDVFRTPEGYLILLIAFSFAGFGIWWASRITRSDI